MKCQIIKILTALSAGTSCKKEVTAASLQLPGREQGTASTGAVNRESGTVKMFSAATWRVNNSLTFGK